RRGKERERHARIELLLIRVRKEVRLYGAAPAPGPQTEIVRKARRFDELVAGMSVARKVALVDRLEGAGREGGAS
ncbi:MAG: hypothetical protein ABFS86_16405, partial [Planctomycetota bacterium]